MVDEDKIIDLLVQWDQRRQQGEIVSAQDMCRDCPELADELERRIADLMKTDWLVDADEEQEEDFLSLPSGKSTGGGTPSNQPLRSLDQFVQAISDSGLLSAEEVAEFRKPTAGESALSLATRLIRENKLTAYQASVLLEGKDAPLLLDHYVILDVLGAGGMGVVFKALHRSLDRVVALKTLLPAAMDSPGKVRRFQREAKAAAKLDHVNIVTTHDAREFHGVHFLVMEYVEGRDLLKVVEEHGPLSVSDAAKYVVQAARGLSHAHSRGITHRDIKPSNLLLSKDGTVKILDMGLSRIDSPTQGDKQTDQALTDSSMVMGTAAYMAPEQAADTRKADHRSDVYSLGCTLYFLLTGHAPYSEETPVQTILAHRERPIPSIADRRDEVPEQLNAVCRQMLAKRPEDRYPSMADVIEALEASCVSTEDGSGTGPPAAGGRLDDGPSRPTRTDGESTPRDKPAGVAGETCPGQRKRSWVFKLVAAVLFVAIGGIALAIIVVKIRTDDGRTYKARLKPTNKTTSPQPDISDGPEPPPREAPPRAVAPFTLEKAKQYQEQWAEHLGLPVEYENSVGMRMVLIPPGEFLMGTDTREIAELLQEGREKGWDQGWANDSWAARFRSEGPQHTVALTEPFYLAVTEVTVGQFRKFVEAGGYKTEVETDTGHYTGRLDTDGNKSGEPGPNPSWNNPGFEQTDDHPVVSVTFNDATAFCRWLSDQQAQSYHLPTEAQWEFACRAGTTTRYYFGDDETDLPAYVWYRENKGVYGAKRVGEKLPNRFGLFDMVGNVREWCSDWCSEDYYGLSPRENPTGPSSGSYRVIRGGSFAFRSGLVRSAYRGQFKPADCINTLGFRPVRTVKAATP